MVKEKSKKKKSIIFIEGFFLNLKEFSSRKEERCDARILKCWAVDMTYETGALRAFDIERRKVEDELGLCRL